MGSKSKLEKFRQSYLEKFAVELLRVGPMPKHIAIILDGNRRFARDHKLDNVSRGHELGGEKVMEVVGNLLSLGVEEVTMYVFSKENFKRPQEEVDAIMKLMLDNLSNDDNARLSKLYGLRYEFIGNPEEAPCAHLRNLIWRNMLLTRDHTRIKLNFAFIYTGRDEITRGINHLLWGLSKGQLETEQVSQSILPHLFSLYPSHPVDILIRTSGECRLSDFLMWQSSQAHLEFVNATWPEFTFWGLATIIFRYQHKVVYKGLKVNQGETGLDEGQNKFVELVRNQAWNQISSSVH